MLALSRSIASVYLATVTALKPPWRHVPGRVLALSRQLSTGADLTDDVGAAPRPTRIQRVDSGKALLIDYANGQRFSLPAELLRVNSPSPKGGTRHAGSASKIISGRRYIHVIKLEPVGNYAIRILFDDMHTSGIYTWQMIHSLGINKYSFAKAYIRELRLKGLSRDPRRLQHNV